MSDEHRKETQDTLVITYPDPVPLWKKILSSVFKETCNAMNFVFVVFSIGTLAGAGLFCGVFLMARLLG